MRALGNRCFSPAIGAVVSSPQRRCREAAAWRAQLWGVPRELDEDLRELDFGLWGSHTLIVAHAGVLRAALATLRGCTLAETHRVA